MLTKPTIKRLNNIRTIISDVAGRVNGLQKFGDIHENDKNTTLIDLNTLIQESLDQTRPLWKDGMEKEGCKLSVSINFEDIPKIKCNNGELKSAIYNIIKNSIEAMPEGGILAIKTGVKEEGVFATFGDTGMGMNKEAKLKIFQPFYSTKGLELGRGLGMSEAYSTVKKNNGNILVSSSEVSKGTTIEIVFPIREENKTNVVIENKPQKKTSFNVLWVDDDIMITELAQILVQSTGQNCTIVNSGKDALYYLYNNSCDIVFTDVSMPEMNGWELADAIRNNFEKNIKIIAVTGWDVDDKKKEQHSIDFVMQKPFTLEGLKEIFQNF